MNNLGWIDFSRSHYNKVMLVMDMFKETGVIDELGLGTIRDAISDILFPGTSTIQTRAKYFLLIPWIMQDIEQRGKTEQYQSELEKAEINFIKVLEKYSLSNTGIIGVRSRNPKRKPSSIYWHGLKTYGILKFKDSLSDYINYQKRNVKEQQTNKKLIIETDENIPGDDKDANHLYHKHLWSSMPKPAKNWKEELIIELTKDEAVFLKNKIIMSAPESLWAYALKHCTEEAKNYTSIEDFLSIDNFPKELSDIIQLAVNFNTIMQGAVLRYNLLIQMNRENENAEKFQSYWENYWQKIKSFNWNNWDTKKLWTYCPLTPLPSKHFVEQWIEIVKKKEFNQELANKLLKERELKLKGLKRARLRDKSLAQKQESPTGIFISENGTVSYLTYRWNNVKTFLSDIQNGLENNVTTE